MSEKEIIEDYRSQFKDITTLKIGERGSEISIRIIYKGKEYDGYLMETN